VVAPPLAEVDAPAMITVEMSDAAAFHAEYVLKNDYWRKVETYRWCISCDHVSTESMALLVTAEAEAINALHGARTKRRQS
jgi:hypothetical protein